MKKALALILLAHLFSVGAAQTISVVAAERGEARNLEATAEIVTGALDAFFMEGCIVTSSETMPFGEGSWEETSLAFARQGYVEYLLALEPLYSSAGTGKLPELAELRYRLIMVSDGRTTAEGRIEAKKPAFPSQAERIQALRAIGSEAATTSIRAARDRVTGVR